MQIRHDFAGVIYQNSIDNGSDNYTTKEVIDFIRALKIKGYVPRAITHQKIFDHIKGVGSVPLRYRLIAREVSPEHPLHPQQVKDCINQLVDAGQVEIVDGVVYIIQ